MIYSSIKSCAGRGLNWYITKSLECPKSLTNCLIIKNYTIFWKHFFLIFHICYQKIVYFYTCYRKRTLNTKIAQMFFQCLILSEIYNNFFGHSELIYWIPIYGNGFLLFLVVECNNPIENILTSMVAIIYSSIKSWVCRWLNWYIIKSLKIHKSLISFLIIKSYTIFEKQIIWIF